MKWRTSKIEEDVGKENNIRKAIQREEEERQNKKREREEQEAANTAASSTPKARPTTLPTQAAAAAAITEVTEPTRPTRQPPIPASQQALENTVQYKKVPATP
eukprot:163058-Amphidinium_carterae.1